MTSVTIILEKSSRVSPETYRKHQQVTSQPKTKLIIFRLNFIGTKKKHTRPQFKEIKTVEDMGICLKTQTIQVYALWPHFHHSNPKYQVPSTDIPNYSLQFMGDPYQTSACEPQLRRRWRWSLPKKGPDPATFLHINFWSCLAAKRTPIYLRWDSGSFDQVTADCSLSCRP